MGLSACFDYYIDKLYVCTAVPFYNIWYIWRIQQVSKYHRCLSLILRQEGPRVCANYNTCSGELRHTSCCYLSFPMPKYFLPTEYFFFGSSLRISNLRVEASCRQPTFGLRRPNPVVQYVHPNPGLRTPQPTIALRNPLASPSETTAIGFGTSHLVPSTEYS